MDSNSLSFTKWNCKYLSFCICIKNRKRVAYGQLKQDMYNILSMLYKRRGVHLVEAEIDLDHVHMLVEIPPNINVSSFARYLRGKVR